MSLWTDRHTIVTAEVPGTFCGKLCGGGGLRPAPLASLRRPRPALRCADLRRSQARSADLLRCQSPGTGSSGSAVVQARRLLRDPHPRLLRRQRRRLRRLPRADREARLPAVARRSTASGSCRCTRRRCATAATTSPTSSPSTPTTATVEDFQAFVEAAHQRGIRVIADLVMNHTSSDHPWFQESRSSPDSPKRDWYVWSDTDERYQDARIIFVDTETSNWTWDPVAGAVLLAPLLLAPARPELRQPRGAGGDAERAALLARPRPRRVPARRRPLPVRARGDELREPARDARVPEARPGGDRRPLPGPRAARRGEPVAGGRRRTTSATATSATWRSTSR